MLLAACAVFHAARAAWYWPFGGDDKEPPRVSELIEEASELMDEAADLAADGKIDEAVDKYREARAELERVEFENPARAATAEFATVRNKKAYIETAIDSLLLKQAQNNVKAVTVTDTTALERRYKTAKALEKKPGDRKLILQAAAGDLEDKHYSAAKAKAAMLLAKNQNDIAALNIYAAAEAASGRAGEAEKFLRHAIELDSKSYHARYNLARLLLENPRLNVNRNVENEPKALYEFARKNCGGPKDEALERLIYESGASAGAAKGAKPPRGEKPSKGGKR